MLGAVADEHDATVARIVAGLDACDILLVTGGVSAGDFDLVPRCLTEAGAETLFHGIALKPGKPTLFAPGTAATMPSGFRGTPCRPLSCSSSS